jgi:hypothetical protein
VRPYVAIALCWIGAAYLFYNSYYGFRYPEKYIRANWTIMSGLPKNKDGASAGAALSMLVGGGFFAGGLMVLHALLTHHSSPLTPLP